MSPQQVLSLLSFAAYFVGDTILVEEFAPLSFTTILPIDLTFLHRRLCHHHLTGIRKLLSGNLVTGLKLDSKLSLIWYVKPAKLVRCMQTHSHLCPQEPPGPSNLFTVMCMAQSRSPLTRAIATGCPSLMTSLTSNLYIS
jgi:hypothetical protein